MLAVLTIPLVPSHRLFTTHCRRRCRCRWDNVLTNHPCAPYATVIFLTYRAYFVHEKQSSTRTLQNFPFGFVEFSIESVVICLENNTMAFLPSSIAKSTDKHLWMPSTRGHRSKSDFLMNQSIFQLLKCEYSNPCRDTSLIQVSIF